MTALMGLGLRLRLARVALRLDDDDNLVERVRLAYGAGADLIVVRVRSPRSTIADLELVRDRMPTRALLGVEGPDAVIKRFGADVVLVPEGGSLRRAARVSHEWALVGRESGALGGAVDFGWLTTDADLATAVDVAPPSDPGSTPWFAATDTPDLDELLAAGVRRCWTASPAAVEALAGRLRAAWAADPAMQAYRFAAAGLPERQAR